LVEEVSARFQKLVDSKLLPDVRRMRNEDFIIRKGILGELYKCGVTRDQLPNLQALADYMGASFRKSDGNKVVVCTGAQLVSYFDKIEDIDDNQ